MKDIKKVVVSKKQAELLNNIFSIKVDDKYLFDNIEGKTLLDQLAGSEIEIIIEK